MPLLSVDYTHINRPQNSRCVFRSGLEDKTKMTAHSRATAPPDLVGGPMCRSSGHWLSCCVLNSHIDIAHCHCASWCMVLSFSSSREPGWAKQGRCCYCCCYTSHMQLTISVMWRVVVCVCVCRMHKHHTHTCARPPRPSPSAGWPSAFTKGARACVCVWVEK